MRQECADSCSPCCRLNQDSHYKDAMVKVIDFKHDRLTKLVKEFSCLVKEIGEPPLVERNNDGEPTDEGNYHKDPLATGLHIAVRDGRAKTLEALVAAGAPAGAVDRVWIACVRMLLCLCSLLDLNTHVVHVSIYAFIHMIHVQLDQM